MPTPEWHFWIDRGGTFTDVVARAPDGALHTAKLLSEDPARYADAAVEAIRRLTGTASGAALPMAQVRLGTTVATNALLERRGARTLLAITRGLGDALRIGTQERPALFARAIVLPEPLYEAVVEIDERVSASGEVLRPLDADHARDMFAAARARGIEAVAIVLLHGWRFPAHERALADLARAAGFAQVSVSHQVTPTQRIVPRGDTTVADATLSPVLQRYVTGFEAALGPHIAPLYMQSSGGLAAGASFHGKDAVLSGPAGGIVGLGAVAREAGLPEGMPVVGFDMGGTSTDVSWYAGAFERDTTTRLAGVRLAVPMLRIHTVAAGGGSICGWDGRRMFVGPASAGAQPGPACYGRGGSLTVTDCNLLLGRLDPAHFPQVFGGDGGQPLDRAASEMAMDAVLAALPTTMTREAAAEGFLAIAVAAMARAIKAVSLARGHDVTRAALVCFGGGGGQLACAVAAALGMREVLCHPLASVLSAWGMGLADRSATRAGTLLLPLDTAHIAGIESAVDRLGAEAAADLVAQGVAPSAVAREAWLDLRPAGTENAIAVAFAPMVAMEAAFTAGWRARFGYAPTAPLIVASARVEAVARTRTPPLAITLPDSSTGPAAQVRFAGMTAPLYARDTLAAGFAVRGPALIVDAVSTVVVDPGWRATIDARGICRLTPDPAASRPHAVADPATCDPVRLEVMGSLFMAVAEQMGAALAASASSVNIRERLDFSCAVFDAAGNLIANAPHMPVHLGSMGESVRAVLARGGPGRDARGLHPGDAIAVNSPMAGGTHLPDVTVVMPVFTATSDSKPAWYVAARGHHADIGGISPGSMPPASTTLAQEGVVLDHLLVVDGSGAEPRLCEAEIRAALAAGPHPARDPDRNLADLAAQVAACTHGAAELARVAREQGRAVVDAYMEHVQAQAEAAVRDLAQRLSDGAFAVETDTGARIAVSVRVDPVAATLTIDFTGTSAQQADNFNAPPAVVRAAVLYVLRCLVDAEIPMNEGCLRPVTLLVPAGSMLCPDAGAAVVAGNVETSQVLCDALFAAFRAMAASQGTMNNLTFGDAARQYYETIAGGAGAGPDHAGASAVQTHMTNSRMTDPEVLEANFPVRLEQFAIRYGSGGDGAHHGGDGVVRRIRFLEPMDAGILANRRATAPFGLGGGGDGAPGVNRIERADGRVEHLPASAAVMMAPGDVFVIETPGGGGFGAPDAN